MNRSALLCLLLLFAWRTPLFADDAQPADPVELAASARRVLRLHCVRCHNGPGSDGGEFNILSVKELQDNDLIAPGKPDESRLLQRIVLAEMPPEPSRLFVDEAHTIRRWLQAGAPPFPANEANRAHVSLETLLTDVNDYLRDRNNRGKASFLRFFTLHNLSNDPRILESDLRLYRAALSKVVNSLSYKKEIKTPQPVGKTGTLFAIDIRDYDWDRTGGWDHTMRAYPYGLKYRNLTNNDALKDLDEQIEEACGCFIPIVRADWFIATATRPELYHQILQIPETAGELEERLGVNIKENFTNPAPGRIDRAGFPKSGVSGQNRLLERHDSRDGYYWKSYDFKADSARSKLTRFPLGPLNLFPEGKHPFGAQAFVHDGGEIIFSLPNGLQAYMLIDGKDQRISEGPIQVVGDALKTSGTYAILNGVSCMSCHKNGMVDFKDTVRHGNSLFGEPERAVKELYPEQAEMDKLVERDRQRFMIALEATLKPYLLPKDSSGKGLEDLAEPVAELARLYRLGYLDLQTIACELDLENANDILTRVGEKKRKQLGLETLGKGGVISRLEWEAIDGVSLMQELARELGYTPISVE